ncbi:MAG: DUF5615 family PIN-like protein [Phycisphaerae bacterium]
MKFKLDENLPIEAADFLRAAGHDALNVSDEGLKGAKDPEIRAACAKEDRELITLDFDFADIRSYPPQTGPGHIIINPARQSKPRIMALIAYAMRLLDTEQVKGRLWIVEEHRVRVR